MDSQRVVWSGWFWWPDRLAVEASRDRQTRATTARTTPCTTLRTTLFSPEDHPNHPHFDVSALNVARRVVPASRAADPSFSEEGGEGGLPLWHRVNEAVAKTRRELDEKLLEAVVRMSLGDYAVELVDSGLVGDGSSFRFEETWRLVPKANPPEVES